MRRALPWCLSVLACTGGESTHGTVLELVRGGFSYLADAADTDPADDVLNVSLTAAPATWRLGETDVAGYAYNGTVPGPTLRAKVGDTLKIHFTNALPEATTIHWHGLAVPWAMDGITWEQDPIGPGETFTYTFVAKSAGTFWYHPHFDAQRQVDLGLYGALVIADPEDPEIPELLLIADGWGEAVAGGGSHGHAADDVTTGSPPRDSATEFLGGHGVHRPVDAWSINGHLEPRVELDSGLTYRVRLINVSNGGYLNLRDVAVVGTDQGVGSALRQGDEVLGPGDRLEFLLRPGPEDFEVRIGPYSMYGGSTLGPDRTLLSVVSIGGAAAGEPPILPFSGAEPTPDPGRTDIVYVFTGSDHGATWLLNGQRFPDIEPERVALGDPVVIEVRNLSRTEHPFHLHGHVFELLSVDGIAPPWRRVEDTINVGVRSRVRLLLNADNPGAWMAHCHILAHADAGMMTVLRVGDD